MTPAQASASGTSLADLLAQRKGDVIERWLHVVTERLAPGEKSDSELRDHIPQYIDELIAALRQGPSAESSTLEGTSRSARSHGRQRYRIGFDLETVVREYGVLRDSVFQLIRESRLNVDLTDAEILSSFFSAGIAEAVSEHAGQLLSQRQSRHTRDRERLERLLLQAPALVAVLRGPQHVFEMANPFYERMVAREVVGKSVREALPEFEGQSFFSMLDEVYRSGTPYEAQGVRVRLAAQRGAPLEDVVLNFVYQPLRNAAGEVDGIFVHAVDVTKEVEANRQRDQALIDARSASTLAESALRDAQRANEALRKSELALRESDRQFRMLANSIPQLAWIAEPDGTIQWFNQRWYEYTGTTPAEMEDQSDLGSQRVHDPKELPRVLAKFKAAMASAEAWEDLFPVRRADGVYRWHLSRAMPVRNADGAIVRWFGTSTDVEEERQSQAVLADRIAFEEQLVGIVNHDLRSPLQAIHIRSQSLLRKEQLDPRLTLSLSRIQSSAERAIRLIGDLLEFTRSRFGRTLPIARQPFDLGQMAARLADDVAIGFPGREVTTASNGDCQGEWDRDRIAQLITNLVTNALKYSPPGTPVSVTVRGAEEYVSLAVHNAGRPIPLETIASVFEPMQRSVSEADGSRRRLGLGLYIVKKIAEAHQGRVEIESSLEAGTTFVIHLPRQQAREGAVSIYARK